MSGSRQFAQSSGWRMQARLSVLVRSKAPENPPDQRHGRSSSRCPGQFNFRFAVTWAKQANVPQPGSAQFHLILRHSGVHRRTSAKTIVTGLTLCAGHSPRTGVTFAPEGGAASTGDSQLASCVPAITSPKVPRAGIPIQLPSCRNAERLTGRDMSYLLNTLFTSSAIHSGSLGPTTISRTSVCSSTSMPIPRGIALM